MKRYIFGLLVIFASVSFGFAGHALACGGWFEASCDSATGQAQSQQQTAADTLAKLISQVPAPQLENSLERQNISKRLTTFSDPAKISYIYLINYGRVMAYYVVKGKITSGGKRLTPSQQTVDGGCNNGCQNVVDAPELDGTYGASNSYIFFWTTDGIYVQWSGDYMLTDQPMHLASQPELVRNVK